MLSIHKTFTILLLFITLTLFSCNKETISIESSINKTYVFDGSYLLTDLNLYLGKRGLIKDFNEQKALTFWPNIKMPYSDTIIINENSDSLILKIKSMDPIYFETHKHNDSIFILRNDQSYTFFCTVDNNNDEITTHLGFYIVRKSNNALGVSLWKGSDFDLQSFNKIFHKNGYFEKPSDMLNNNDIATWCNIYYRFKKMN